MKHSLCLVSLSLFAAQAAAQAPLNEFHVYTNSTSFTSRGFLGVAAGETLQGYPTEQFRGIGDMGTVPKEGRVHAFRMITQDQDRTTAEKFRIVFRLGDSILGPDGTAAGLISQTGELSLPVSPGTGPIAYNVTVNLGSDGVVVPTNHTFFAGVSLAANAKWTADGQSSHASAYSTPASATGDPVRDGAPNHSWQVDAAGATRQTNPRSWNYALLTQRGAFQVGALQTAAGNGLFGNCGNYPDPKTHGLAFRIRDEAQAGHAAVVFASTALIGGAPLPFDGTLWINPGTLLVVGAGTLSANGDLELKPADWGPGKLAGLEGFGNVAFQAAIEDIGNGKFDIRTLNGHATNL